MKSIGSFFVVAPLLLTGCATNTLHVTYHSDLPGATIVQADGQNFGRAPITLNYPISPADRTQGKKLLRGLTAQWPSGAKEYVSTITASLRQGTNQVFTFKRPEGAPGLAVDMQYALELEKLAEMKRQSAAQENAAYEAQRAADAAEKAAKEAKRRALQPAPIPVVNCYNSGVLVTCF